SPRPLQWPAPAIPADAGDLVLQHEIEPPIAAQDVQRDRPLTRPVERLDQLGNRPDGAAIHAEDAVAGDQARACRARVRLDTRDIDALHAAVLRMARVELVQIRAREPIERPRAAAHRTAAGRRGDRRLRGATLPVAHVRDRHFRPDAEQRDPIAQIVAVADLAPVERDDHVPRLEACLLGRRPGLDLRDQRAALDLEPERFGELRRDRLDEYTEPSAAHLAVLDELLHDGPRHVRRHGETDADIAAG